MNWYELSDLNESDLNYILVKYFYDSRLGHKSIAEYNRSEFKLKWNSELKCIDLIFNYSYPSDLEFPTFKYLTVKKYLDIYRIFINSNELYSDELYKKYNKGFFPEDLLWLFSMLDNEKLSKNIPDELLEKCKLKNEKVV